MNLTAYKKKHLLKRLLTTALSAAIFCTALPAVPCAAKAPYVSLRTRFKTLKVGQTNRMTLKNNTIGWKIKKVSADDSSIAAVYSRTKNGFMIEGKSVGRTTVRARLKTTSRKKHTSKLVRCRVNVIAADAADTQTPARTQAIVSSQEELQAALKETGLRVLAVQTSKTEKLTIPNGSYTNIALTVDAPAADIDNYGTFQSITIQSIKPDTWTEYASGNTLRVLAQTSRIVVNKGARIKSIDYAKADAKAILEINGTTDLITVSEKTKLTVKGTPEETPDLVIKETAADTSLETESPLHIDAYADADLTFKKGSEKSTVNKLNEFMRLTVVNESTASITITKPDGSKEVIQSKHVPIYNYTVSGGGSSLPPSVTTTPAITTTGPSISDTETVGNSGNKKPIFSPDKQQLNELITKVIKAEAVYTITKSAVKYQNDFTFVTASSIMSFELQPDQLELPDGVYAEWSCDGLSNNGQGGWERLEGDRKKFTLPEQNFIHDQYYWPIPEESYIGVNFILRFKSDTMLIGVQDLEILLTIMDVGKVNEIATLTMYNNKLSYIKTKPMPLTKWQSGFFGSSIDTDRGTLSLGDTLTFYRDYVEESRPYPET